VLQESLANTLKHAKANTAIVQLRFDERTCELVVRDDGRGFDVNKPPPIGHYGLLNMQERARRVGGLARVDSVEGSGTTVSLRVPLVGLPALEPDTLTPDAPSAAGDALPASAGAASTSPPEAPDRSRNATLH